MGYTIRTVPDTNIVTVIIEGQLSLPDKKAAYTAAFDALQKNGWSRLLFDVTNGIESKTHTLGDTIDLFKKLKIEYQPQGVKLAYLSENSDHRHRIFGVFLKAIADMDTRHFIRRDEALNWLREA